MSNAPTPSRKPQVSPVRNLAGVVLLVVLAGVGFLEYSANQGYNSAMNSLDAALGNEEGDLLTQAEVEAMIGKTADGPLEAVGGELRGRYTWRGLFRSYDLTAYYLDQKPPRLLRLGDPAPADPGVEPPAPAPVGAERMKLA